MRAACVLRVGSLLAVCWGPVALAEPAEWLVRISEAARTANYQGVMVYSDDRMLETLRIVHRYRDGDERERLISLNGEAREILRQGDRVTCILPRERKVTMDRRGIKGLFPTMSQETVQQLAEHYELKDLGEARVAGHICRGISVSPRDEYRYGYTVCADSRTAVPLKVSLLNQNGRVLEQLLFTEIEFPATIPDAAFKSDVDTSSFQQVTGAAGDPKADGEPALWVMERLPPGFRLTVHNVRQLPDNKGTVEHLLLTDGLSAVSIFSAHKQPPEKMFNGVSHMGAMHAYGRMIGSYHITVVGEVPPETVRMIGDGLRPADPAMAGAAGSKP